MKTPSEYLQLASHFEAAADSNLDQRERENLRDLARIYFMLATTAKRLGQIKSGRRTKQSAASR